MKRLSVFGEDSNRRPAEEDLRIYKEDEIILSSSIEFVLGETSGNLPIPDILDLIEETYLDRFEKEESLLGRTLMCYDFAMLKEMRRVIEPLTDHKVDVPIKSFIERLVHNYMQWNPIYDQLSDISLVLTVDRPVPDKIKHTKLITPQSEEQRVLRKAVLMDLITVLYYFKHGRIEYDEVSMLLADSSMPRKINLPEILDCNMPGYMLSYYTWMYHGMLLNLDYLERLVMRDGFYNPAPIIECNSYLLGRDHFPFGNIGDAISFQAFYKSSIDPDLYKV